MGERLEAERLVLDSWPILQWLKGREPVYSAFVALIDSAIVGEVQLHLSRINFGEVIYTVRKAPDIASVEGALRSFRAAPFVLHTIDDALVDEAVELKSHHGISYADAFAAALAVRLSVPLVTGDREFRKLEEDGLLELKWVGV